jgi:NAD(P)-dependent dehydrogenase (short-subunit alcohol dehydrogenase family)
MARASYDVNGRTVFITGAARGIGAESARRLHAKGANLALVGLEPERLEALAAELGDRTAVFEADTTDAGALERAAAGTVAQFGGIDVAIANAGIQLSGAVLTGNPEAIERTMEVNLFGVWRTDRAVLRHIIDRKGYLLNVASLAAISHAPLMAAYAASKAGVEAFTDALRVETAPTGAKVGCAYFGFIDTDIVRGSFAQPSAQAMMKMMPGGLTRPAPLSYAIDAIEQGVERRSARVWAPRFVGPAMVLRGIIQPVSEWRMIQFGLKHIAEGTRLADPATGADKPEDPLLGASSVAIDEGNASPADPEVAAPEPAGRA